MFNLIMLLLGAVLGTLYGQKVVATAKSVLAYVKKMLKTGFGKETK